MKQPSDHPMVLGALGRLATQGGWSRILARKPLEDALDLNDAELLVACGLLRRDPGDVFDPVPSHPWFFDSTALAGGVVAMLRRALRHAEGGTAGWTADDLHVVKAQGKGSVAAAMAISEGLLPQMPAAHQAFLDGHARFLDIGVGVGAIAQHICEMFPGVTAVGLDVLGPVLEVARTELGTAGMLERVELRLQSVADLSDECTFDLAWLPQAFIPRADLAAGVRAVHRALVPDRWVIAPIMATPDSADDFQVAIQAHGAHLTGGGSITVAEMRGLLEGAGFVDVKAQDHGDQVVMLARRA
jgi:SAM-dependent methyltransferase